jgi:carboxymethylenebutenolidase
MVLVLHAWWGLNGTIEQVCDDLAAAGYLAFAPDLYHGEIASTIEDAEGLATALDQRSDQARQELSNAVEFLRGLADAEQIQVAVIGFSLGAYYALDLSTRHPANIDRVVVFYGTGPADFSRSNARYLGHFAASDPYEPQENLDDLEAALKDAGRPVQFYQYPGTGHWFFEPDRPDAYDGAAAQLAWERTLAFLAL